MPDVIVERTDRGVGTGMMLGIIIAGLAVVVALFIMFGGPSRFMGSGAPNQTNVNVPAENQAPNMPNITIPREIDINVNQQPAPAAAPAPAVAPAANP